MTFFAPPNAICWICGAPADSAEHMVKASDFRSAFGEVTHKAPAYRHSEGQPNVPVRGAKANILKFAPSLCCVCNTTRTQVHDRAWQTFSNYIRALRPALSAGSRIPVHIIFPGSVERSMLGIHLYFLKLLGCYAIEYKIPLPLAHFGLCIQNGIAHPSLRLIFVHIAPQTTRYNIQVGHINANNVDGKTVSASWFYIVENIGVAISYVEADHRRLTRDRGWHPCDIGAQIRMAATP